MISRRSLYFLGELGDKFSHIQRLTPVHPLRQHTHMHAAALTEPIAALSGISRASRCTIVSIQRHPPSLPPAISAGNLHKLQ